MTAAFLMSTAHRSGIDFGPLLDGKGNEYRCEVLDLSGKKAILLWGRGEDELFATGDDEYGISVEEWADLTPFMPDRLVEQQWADSSLQRPRRNTPPE